MTSNLTGLNQKVINGSSVRSDIECYVKCMNLTKCQFFIYNPSLIVNCFLGNNNTLSSDTFPSDILVGAKIS